LWLRPVASWPPGIYEGPPLLWTRLVVVNELPVARDTLLVRLLGAGAVLKQAITELKELQAEAPERTLALPILVAVFGAGLIASARFRCDAGLGYPPGAPEDWPRTASEDGNRHNLAGAAVFASLAIACFLSAARFDGRPWTLYCVTSGVLLLVLFVATGALAARASDSADPPIGVTQRLAILVGWTWMAVLALRLSA
jgi:hypothetical protein